MKGLPLSNSAQPRLEKHCFVRQVASVFNVQGSVHHKYIQIYVYIQQDATLHSLFISGKLLYMFRVVSPPIIRSTNNCIYSIWYLSNRYCYLPLSWKSWGSSDSFPDSCVCSWWWVDVPPETCTV